MLRRGQTTTFQERLDITERAAAGQSNPEIATLLSAEKLTRRYQKHRDLPIPAIHPPLMGLLQKSYGPPHTCCYQA